MVLGKVKVLGFVVAGSIVVGVVGLVSAVLVESCARGRFRGLGTVSVVFVAGVVLKGDGILSLARVLVAVVTGFVVVMVFTVAGS